MENEGLTPRQKQNEGMGRKGGGRKIKDVHTGAKDKTATPYWRNGKYKKG